MIIVLLLLLNMFTVYVALRQLQTQPQTVYIDKERALSPDAFIASFYNYPIDDNTVRTTLALKNRATQRGVVTVEYYSVNGGFIEVKEYYINVKETKSFEEIWSVPDDYTFVQCKILKQEIAD